MGLKSTPFGKTANESESSSSRELAARPTEALRKNVDLAPRVAWGFSASAVVDPLSAVVAPLKREAEDLARSTSAAVDPAPLARAISAEVDLAPLAQAISAVVDPAPTLVHPWIDHEATLSRAVAKNAKLINQASEALALAQRAAAPAVGGFGRALAAMKPDLASVAHEVGARLKPAFVGSAQLANLVPAARDHLAAIMQRVETEFDESPLGKLVNSSPEYRRRYESALTDPSFKPRDDEALSEALERYVRRGPKPTRRKKTRRRRSRANRRKQPSPD